MNDKLNPNLIEAKELFEHLNDPDVLILDASSLDNMAGKRTEYQGKYLPGARYFDLKNEFSDSTTPFPNTFPSVQQFEQNCRKLGIHSHSKLVIYDNLGVYNSPRVWWMFKTMGHPDVKVLNGGLPEWIKLGFPTQNQLSTTSDIGNFQAHPILDQIKLFEQIQENINSPSFLVIDARAEGRFKGQQPEPRVGLPSGHIPQSVNIPYTEVLHENKFKSKAELKAIFEDKIKTEQALVFSCGSGLTACIILFAYQLIGAQSTAIYDGSWTEYATLSDARLIATDPN